ncbi:MAG: hypothetical protein WBA22_04015 [Candidatus Methanofastidiosia archaeon]
MKLSCKNPKVYSMRWKLPLRSPRTKKKADLLEKYRPIAHPVSIIRTDRKAKLNTIEGIS